MELSLRPVARSVPPMSPDETMTGEFRFETSESPPTTSGHAAIVVRLVGRLDASSNAGCDRRLADLVSAGHHRFIFECSELSFVSSMGIGTFLQVLRSVKSRGGGVTLCRTCDGVRQTLMLAGLGKVLMLEPDLESSARRL